MASKSAKKKLADMDIDDFMAEDFDSEDDESVSEDEEESSEEEEEEENVNVQVEKNGKDNMDHADEENSSDEEESSEEEEEEKMNVQMAKNGKGNMDHADEENSSDEEESSEEEEEEKMNVQMAKNGKGNMDHADEENSSDEEESSEEEEEEKMNVQMAKNGKGNIDHGDKEKTSDEQNHEEEDEEESEDEQEEAAGDDEGDESDDDEDIDSDSSDDDTSGEEKDEDEDSSSDDTQNNSKIQQTAQKKKSQEDKSRTKAQFGDENMLNSKSSETAMSAKKKANKSSKTESKKGDSKKENKQSDISGSRKQDEATAVIKGPKETSGKTGKKQSAIDKHKKSIESLKEKDPDFYQFLQENDQELLNFEDSDASEDDDDANDEDEVDDGEDESFSDEEGAVHKLPEKLEEVSDEEGESSEEEEGGNKRSKSGVLVTIAMVDKWGDQLEDNNIKAFRELVEAFAAAVQGMPDDQEEEMETKYKVQGSNVFNAIVSLCLKGVHPMLQNLLKMDNNTSKRLSLPSNSKAWKNVHSDVREYLLQVIQLLAHMVDPAIVCVVVRHIHKMIPYYCCYPKMTRSLIKKLVPLWSTGEETVRVVAFLCLFSITRHMKKPNWLELILKQMYMAYVKNTKFTSPSTLPLITFMQRSLTEMFALNSQITYQHAFVYIRQLAIHLRNAITIKKDQYQSVYNWQYIHCVWLWCRVLGTLHADQTLQPLIYPLVQTAIGVIKLIPAAKYIPLRFSVVRALNILSDATETFIPLLPHILDVFDIVDFNKRPVGVSFRPLNFAVVLKLSSKQLAEKGFKDGLMDEIYELILEHLVIHSHTISFPELALPVILKLKAFIKGSRVPSYSKLMKGLLDKIQENCREVTQKRDTVTFGLADDQAVRAWETKMKEQGTALSKHYTTYKPLRERELKTEEAGKDRLLDLNFPTIEKRERQRKMKEEDKEDFKELFEKDSDSEDDILVRAERREQRKKEDRKKGKKRRKQDSDEEDEDDLDSDFSDDDDGLDDFDDESEDGDGDSDGEEEEEEKEVAEDSTEELGSDGDLKVHKAKSCKNDKSKRTKGKEEPQKIMMDDDDKMDDIQDVVEDFKLWSEDEEGEGGKPSKKKKKLDQGKGKIHGKGKKKKRSKKAKMET